MIPVRKKSFSLTMLRLVAVLSSLSFLALAGLWLANDLLRFEAETTRFRQEYMQERRDELVRQVGICQTMIADQRANLDRTLREHLRQRVQEAWSVADSLYRNNTGHRKPDEIAGMIREALRPIRYNNGRGYFFATNLDGTEELFADQPHLEGMNLLGMRDLEGRMVIQDMIALVREHGEGFYEYLWTKPDSQGQGHRKLAFIKYFPQLDWFIGTGEYLADADEDLGREILRLMEYYQFGNGGYFFASTMEGIGLIGPGKGRNVLNVEDANGVKVVQELIRTAAAGGGFVEYEMPAVDGAVQHQKLSYVVPFPDWNWYVGAGINVEAAEVEIVRQRERLVDDWRQRVATFGVFLLVILVAQYYLAGWAGAWLKGKLGDFMAAFREAEASGTPLDANAQPYAEMEALALSANVMIERRVQAERALRDSEARYRRLVDNAHDAIVLFDKEGAIVDANRVASLQLGLTREEMSSLSIWDVDLDVTAETFETMFSGLHAASSIMNVDTLRRGNGSSFPAEILFTRFQEDGRDFVLGIARDITERQSAEMRLRQSEAKFVLLFQASPDAIILTDAVSERIREANTACVTTFGRPLEDLLGRTTLELGLYRDPGQRAAVHEQVRRDGSVQNAPVQIRRADGEVLMCLLSAQPLRMGDDAYVIATFHDITEQMKIQEIMIQTEKMMSVGGIAAGIAHEINNPLGVIMQTAQILELRTRADFPKNQEVAEAVGLDLTALERYMKARKLDEFLDQIQVAGKRAAGIIRNMLDFSRRAESQRTFCAPRTIVEKAIVLAESDYDLKKNYDFRQIRIDIVEHGDIPNIFCSETEIEQVVLNILRNAAQAMAARGGREPHIAIRLSSTRQDVRLEIEDNGPGIPPEIARRVFVPFFTTKKPGEGTGLGLSVSYFIITQGHGGSISVTSREGQGTCFTIVLPAGREGNMGPGNIPVASAEAEG